MGAFDHVWDSQGTQSQAQVSVWAASMNTSLLHSNKVRRFDDECANFRTYDEW